MKKKFILLIVIVLLVCGCKNNVIDKEKNNDYKSGLKCVSNLELKDGVVYTNNQYSYKFSSIEDSDAPDGWIIHLSDKTSTEPATSEICETIDGLPIVSTYGMYLDSQTPVIDISTLKSENVESMRQMFDNTRATKIIGLDKLNTSNVRDMSYMFFGTNLEDYNVSNFDTSNVNNMESMFMFAGSNDYHIENFKIRDDLNVTGMFGNADNVAPNVYVNSQDRDKWNNLLGLETK